MCQAIRIHSENITMNFKIQFFAFAFAVLTLITAVLATPLSSVASSGLQTLNTGVLSGPEFIKGDSPILNAACVLCPKFNCPICTGDGQTLEEALLCVLDNAPNQQDFEAYCPTAARGLEDPETLVSYYISLFLSLF